MNRIKNFARIAGISVILIVFNFWFTSSFVFANEKSAQEEFVYNDHGVRDPFWPLVSNGGAILTYDKDLLISELTLEGIMVGADGKNLAIINGRILQKNDEVGEFIISEIQSDGVILMKNQEKFELRLKKEE